jgi:hypothetical protein
LLYRICAVVAASLQIASCCHIVPLRLSHPLPPHQPRHIVQSCVHVRVVMRHIVASHHAPSLRRFKMAPLHRRHHCATSCATSVSHHVLLHHRTAPHRLHIKTALFDTPASALSRSVRCACPAYVASSYCITPGFAVVSLVHPLCGGSITVLRIVHASHSTSCPPLLRGVSCVTLYPYGCASPLFTWPVGSRVIISTGCLPHARCVGAVLVVSFSHKNASGCSACCAAPVRYCIDCVALCVTIASLSRLTVITS